MTSTFDAEHVARARLTYLAEPGDPVLASWLEVSPPAAIVAAISAGQLPELPGIQTVTPDGILRRTRDLQAEKVEHAFRLWRQRLGDLPDELDLARFRRQGIRLVGPGDSEWPTQLNMLGVARPYALWLRGEADLRYCCLQSVSIVGARAASAYGTHVGTEMAAALAARGWAVVSGAAYGIDACAHQGALAADGVTIAVLACGVDHAYPPGHYDLLASIAAQGVLVSEWPPGRTPNRLRFLIRNRVIAALTRGTVVVEAGLRSGALNTARHARDLHRPVMAVPGPVTSEVSAGCHKIIREWAAVCVTGAHDVLELLAPLGETSAYGRSSPDGAAFPDPGSCPPTGIGSPANPGDLVDPGRPAAPGDLTGQLSLVDSLGADHPLPPGPSPRTAGPAVRAAQPRPGRQPLLPTDDLGATSRAVLDAIPARGAGPAVIAVRAGRSVDAVVSCLGLLAAGGFVERCSHGWRLRRSP
jgi:DNA processing protein